MAKKRVKKRTHVGAPGVTPAPGRVQATKPGERTPKSMVIRIGAGEVGPSVSQLIKDVRSMMEPGTAARLKERKSNKLRDFTTMAGPLGVTHLLLFSRSESGNVNMRLAITPRGPTLHFRINKYSLCKDISKSMRRPKSGTAEFLTSPLLVMNNFMSPNADSNPNPAVPKHLEQLTTTVFQSLFAPISPQSTSLNSIKRVLLLDRVPTKASSSSDEAPYVIQLRHYAISTPLAKSSLPKALRRLDAASHGTHAHKKHLPNLGKLADVSDYLLDPAAAAGFTSESEPETDAEVEVLAPESRKVLTSEQRRHVKEAQRARIEANGDVEGEDEPKAIPKMRTDRVEKKAIKLTELGPRMTLRLTKVEEGLCGGKIMWHEYIHKSSNEIKAMNASWAKRNKEKEERRRQQKENIERKKKERAAQGKPAVDEDEEMEGLEDEDADFWEDDGLDEDAEADEPENEMDVEGGSEDDEEADE